LLPRDGRAAAIATAQAGIYRPRAMRALPPELRDRYFTEQGGNYVVDPSLARRVTSWSVVNLMAPGEVATHARSPIIFCRNAFIYFSPAAIKRVVDQFAALMPPPAYLCVGAAESLLNVTTAFSLEEIDRAFVYVKRSADE